MSEIRAMIGLELDSNALISIVSLPYVIRETKERESKNTLTHLNNLIATELIKTNKKIYARYVAAYSLILEKYAGNADDIPSNIIQTMVDLAEGPEEDLTNLSTIEGAIADLEAKWGLGHAKN